MLKTNKFHNYYNSSPLAVIMLAGLVLRMLAAIFSRGYGWHDDQFLIIEIAQSWVDGIDYYSWLPNVDGTNIPEGFSFFYVGLHYLLFSFLEIIGLTDPQGKMLIVRLIHAGWSMLVIYFGYQITLKLSNSKNAILVGWILALFWIFPMISVRNLVEYVSVPLLLYGIYLIIISENKNDIIKLFWAGIIFGLAFNIRFQTGVLIASIGLVMLIQRRWKDTLFLTIGGITPIIVFQGGIDYFVWGSPFVQLVEYVNYNMHNAALYVVSPWYTYILFLLGILIPPISVFIFLGFFKKWKSLLLFFLPLLIFIIFHSYYPNKQERFIVTIMPMLIIIGIIGWQEIQDKLIIKKSWRKFITGSWVFFWIINSILVLPVTVMYSKKARVETMTYLSNYKDINYFIIEDVNKTVVSFPPQFYLEEWYQYHTVMKNDDFNKFQKDHINKPVNEQPGFILFFQPDNLDFRVDRMKGIYPELELESVIEPGTMDYIIYWLNPINANQNIYIYRNKAVIPYKLESLQ